MVKGHVFQYGCVIAWYSGEPLCQILWLLSGFCVMPKEDFARIFCAKCYGFARPWYSTVPVRILAYGSVLFWFLPSLELICVFCIGSHFSLILPLC
jgi:hypothetical protein